MPQLLLDDVQWRILIRQLEAVCVTQAVSVDALLNSCLSGEPLDHGPDVSGLQRITFERAEDPSPPADSQFGSPVQPPLKDSPRTLVKSNEPSLVTLSVQDTDRTLTLVQIFRQEGQCLADSQSSAVQHDEQRPIPNPSRRSVGCRTDQ